MSPVTNKVIAVTGAASGIGLATSKLLAERGARLSLADLNQSALETAASSIKSITPDAQILTTVLDVRSTETVDAWIAKTVAHFGQLDGAANLAGVIGPSIGVKGVAELTDEEWDFVSGVNLTGSFKCLRAQLRALTDGGSIVNTASVAGIRGFAFNPAYTASKHGVVGLTKGAAKEVGNRNIRVNCICPGYIETPMTALSDKIHNKAGKSDEKEKELIGRVPLHRPGQPDEVAQLICFLLGDESKFITGAAYTIDGGFVA